MKSHLARAFGVGQEVNPLNDNKITKMRYSLCIWCLHVAVDAIFENL